MSTIKHLKPVLAVLLSLVALTTTKAQIEVMTSFDNDLIIIGNISSGEATNAIGAIGGNYNNKVATHKLYCRILGDKTTYGILVDTENRFDDDFEFALGTDIETATTSLNTILEFMEDSPLGTTQLVKDEDGRTIQLHLPRKFRQINNTNRNILILKAIDAHDAIICDNIQLTRSNLQRAIKLLDKKAEKKVNDALSKSHGY